MAASNETLNDGYIVYPNPATGFIKVLRPRNENLQVELIDMAGRVRMKKNLSGKDDMIILQKGIMPGMYLLKMNSSNGYKVKKIIIQ